MGGDKRLTWRAPDDDEALEVVVLTAHGLLGAIHVTLNINEQPKKIKNILTNCLR